MVESTSHQDVRGVPAMDLSEMNDVKMEEFRIVSMRMKDAEKG